MRLTLDALEAERGEDNVEPFELELSAGVVVTLPHPRDMPFESLVNFNAAQPAMVLRALMGDDTFDKVVSETDATGRKRVTLGVLEGILNAYYAHFGLAGPGEDGASPPSLIGSARRSKPTSRRKASA